MTCSFYIPAPNAASPPLQNNFSPSAVLFLPDKHRIKRVIAMKEQKRETAQRPWLLPTLAVLLGALAGSLTCAGMDVLQKWMQQLGQGSLTENLLPELLVLMLLTLSGFLRMGGVWALALLAGKGFLLGAEAAAMANGVQAGAYLMQALPAILPGFLTLCAYLLLARQSIYMSSRRLRLPPGKVRNVRPDTPFYVTAGVALLVIFAAMLLKQRLFLLKLPELLPEGIYYSRQLGICLPV